MPHNFQDRAVNEIENLTLGFFMPNSRVRRVSFKTRVEEFSLSFHTRPHHLKVIFNEIDAFQ